MIKHIKDFFLSAVFEYSVALLLLVYILIHDAIGLPSFTEILMFIERGFQNYGLLFLVIGLLIEGLFMIGLYFPGSTVAFAAVIFLGKTPIDLVVIILVGTLSLILVSIINYFLGKYGYYKLFKYLGAETTLNRMEKRFEKGYKPTLMIFSSSPNFLAIASVYAGIARINLSKYLSFAFLCLVFWISVVSIILHLFVTSEDLYSTDNVGWIAFGIIFTWALIESILTFVKNKKSTKIN